MSSKYSWNAYGVRGAVCAAMVCAIIAWGATENSQAAAERSAGSTGVRTVDVPGSNVILKLWEETSRERGLVPYYSISLDGETFSEPRATSYTLKLRHGDFDPLALSPAPAIEEGFGAGEDTNLYIVQYVTQPLEEFTSAVRELGGTVYWYLAHHSHIVRMDRQTLEAVEDLPFVRWVGPYHPAYRLEEFMLDNAAEGDRLFPLEKYNIMVFEPGMKQKTAVAARIAQIGGIVEQEHAGKYLLEATLTPEQLFEVIRWDDVLFVDHWSPLQPDMDISRETSGADYVETVAGYTGEGVRGESFDTGFNLGHPDFQSNPLIVHGPAPGLDSHGTACIGVCFGDGTGDPQARGIMPDGQGIVTDYNHIGFEYPARYDHTGELLDFEAVFQTASVGADRTTEYTTISADTDAALFDFDVVLCQSQSNAGSQDSRPQAWAKNIISGGGVYHENTLTKADDHWSYGGSIGPAADGRIKPDLCHFYDSCYTTYTTGSGYGQFSGTSNATPNICGYTGLFFQMWADGIFGNPVDPSGSVFDNRCHMTTAKAMMINTADQYPFSGTGHDLTRTHQGWGMPDLQNMYDLRYKMLIIDETELLTNMGSAFYSVAVVGGDPLKATLIFSDPPGNPSSSVHRINDLSLKVTSPSGTEYWGNKGLLSGNWSAEGGEPNGVDTVENVFVETPEPGMWSIEVYAHEIIEDGHVETPELDADFALVVSGVEETLPALVLVLPSGVPDMIPPGVETVIDVQIVEGEESVVPGTEMFHYRLDEGDEFTTVPMEHLGGIDYVAMLPGAKCDETPQFYLSAEGDGGTLITHPSTAPAAFHSIDTIGEVIAAYSDDFDINPGWSTENKWAFGKPTGGGGDYGGPDPVGGHTGNNVYGYNLNGDYDNDMNEEHLTSTPIDCSEFEDVRLQFWRWLGVEQPNYDHAYIRISTNGTSWTTVWENGGEVTDSNWVKIDLDISDIADGQPTVYIRWTMGETDGGWRYCGWNIDDVKLTSFQCVDVVVEGDVNGDGVVDVIDLIELLAAWGECPDPPADCPADFNGDGAIDVLDLIILLANWS